MLTALAVMDVAPATSATTAASTTVTRPREGLVIAGALTLGTTYFLSAGFSGLTALGMAGHSSDEERRYFGWMFVPILGLWVSLGYAGGTNATGLKLIASTSGTLQAVGAGLITLGLTWKTKTVVPTSVARVELVALPDGAGLVIRAIGF